jgi:prephenate dehydrogenase
MRDQADSIGFYSNPELYREVMKAKENNIESSDDDFDKASELIDEIIKNKDSDNKKVSKKRRKIKNNRS